MIVLIQSNINRKIINRMRIITWNCQGAFRKKADIILKQQPDILIVQECEHPEKLFFTETTAKPNQVYWHGDNKHKGIGIFSYSDYRFELLPEFNPLFRYILPFRVSGNNSSFILFAIWAMDNKENYDARYIGQIWVAINYYTSLLNSTSILLGDFNSNKIWDKTHRLGNHSNVVALLAEKNIVSVYHNHYGIEQGEEKHPSFYLQRNLLKPYHIDYCFASKDRKSVV